MKVLLKTGVVLSGLDYVMLDVIKSVSQVWHQFGYDTCTITSGLDGRHMSNSLHYKGLALDFRTRDIDTDNLPLMVDCVRADLGNRFDVVVESDHLHVEYDPAGLST